LNTAEQASEDRLMALVLDSVTSPHSRRSYKTGLECFFAWVRVSATAPTFTKALAGQYRTHLLAQGLSSASINLRLSPIRRLAREMADNQLLDSTVAAAIERVPGIERRGNRVGNWLTKEQANELLNAPDAATLIGKRDRAILALLVGCGLRRAELVSLSMESIQQREARWVIPDLLGKGNRARTVTIPAGVKARIDQWTCAAGITEGRLFRPVHKGGFVQGSAIRDEKAIWRLVVRYARDTELGKLAPHDLRRTCAKLCRKAGGDLEQIQLLLGHASVQTTERYLGTEQNLVSAVNDGLGLDLG
jgi:site-specific recombinase XerD